MSNQNPVRHRVPRRPDRDPRICAGGHRTPIAKHGDRVYRAVVQPQDLLGDIAAQWPADRRCVKTPGQRDRAVAGNGKSADRAAMSAQLRRSGCPERHGAQQEANQGEALAHVDWPPPPLSARA
jgi:hypothetical protein